MMVGAETLVRGASRLASSLEISPLVVDLTVVALGTSSPELAVGVGAAVSARADIAVANVVGSSIFDVLFILGLSAIIVSLTVAQQLMRFDVPSLLGCSLPLAMLAADGVIGCLEDAFLLSGAIL